MSIYKKVFSQIQVCDQAPCYLFIITKNKKMKGEQKQINSKKNNSIIKNIKD